jgi:hypothetical protein
MARAASKVPSASLTIWLCHGISQFTRIRGPDPWHACSPGEHASRVHHGPFPLPPRGLHRIEPGTLTRAAAAHHATAPGLLGWTRVALEPCLPRLADVPGGLVPDAHARPLALGGTVCGPPGQPGAGDRADGTPVDTASPPVVGRGPREPITGPRLACRVLGRPSWCHEADRRAGAPSRHLGRGLTPPPDGSVTAQGEVRMGGGEPDQPSAWLVLNALAGSGLTAFPPT